MLRVAPALVLASMLALTQSVQGSLVLFDLGNNSSFRGANTPSPDVNGNHWNSVWSGAFYPNVVDSTGAATAIDFGFSSVGGTDYFNGPSGATQSPAATVYNAAALGPLGVNEAVYDYYVNSTFQIQQLDPTKTYDLTFFGSHKFNSDNVTRYTLYTDSTFSASLMSVDLTVGVNSAHNQDMVASLAGVSPQPDGILYVGFQGANGGNGYLNAMSIQMTAIPEPTSAMACLTLILAATSGRRPSRN